MAALLHLPLLLIEKWSTPRVLQLTAWYHSIALKGLNPDILPDNDDEDGTRTAVILRNEQACAVFGIAMPTEDVEQPVPLQALSAGLCRNPLSSQPSHSISSLFWIHRVFQPR